MPIGDTNYKGNLAELRIAAEAAENGIGVWKPMTEHGRSDLVFEVGSQLLRVQCKWARRVDDVVIVQTGGSYHSPTRGYVRSTYSAHEIDGVAAYSHDIGRCYFLPIGDVEGMSVVHLRLAPAKNGQLAGVRMASEYEFGAVAQLAERRRGTAEAGGSNPPSSIHTDHTIVGADELRIRFGWYMQRAAAGETFRVTRRGKPHVRLSPGDVD